MKRNKIATDTIELHKEVALSESVMEKNRFFCILEGATARIIFNLTTGAFLVGFLKLLGASDTVCGYIMAVPVLATAVQFLSPIVLEKLEFRLRIITVFSALHRGLLSLMIIILFLPLNNTIRIWLAAIIIMISNLSLSFVNPAVSNLYVSFVSPNARGKYFGLRESYLLISSAILSLLMGKILDIFKESGNERGGFAVIYGTIFVLMLVNLFSYLNMKEIPLKHNSETMKIKEVFTLPLKNKKFRKFFVLSILWNIGIMVSASYFGIYQVADLKLSFTEINLLGIISSFFYFISAPVWGRIADKISWAYTTMLSLAIIGISCSIWFFVVKDSPFMFVLLYALMILSGLGWSGINISMFNLQFDFMPEEKRTVYIGFNSTVSGISGFLASAFGSMLVGIFGELSIDFIGIPIGIKQILFMTSGLLIVFCALYIFLFMLNRSKDIT
jgi:MFS family permease